MALGLDFSDARPGGAALAAAGVLAVGRYLSDSADRAVTAAEYADLQAHGVGLWVCRESSATAVLGGRAQGVQDATDAVRMLADAGLPADTVVYATVDFDIAEADLPTADAYMDGWLTVIPLQRTGGYGGLRVLNHWFSTSRAAWFWKCASSSFDHGAAPQMTVHIEQTTDAPPLPGTDYNIIYTAVFGQVGASTTSKGEEDMAFGTLDWDTNGTGYLTTAFGVLPLPSQAVYNLFYRKINSNQLLTPFDVSAWVPNAQSGEPQAFHAAEQKIVDQNLKLLVASAQTGISIDETKLAEAIKDAGVTITAEEDPEKLAAAFEAAVPQITASLLKQAGQKLAA